MIKEEALFGKIEIQTPNFAVMGFVLGFSRLGDSMAATDAAYNTGTYNLGTYNLTQAATPWNTWTGKTLRIGVKRGGVRTGLGIKTDVGLLTFTLRNDQDPLKGGTFRHNQPIRVLSSGQAIFTGYIIDVAASYPLDKSNGKITPLVTVTAADAVKTHVGTPRYGVRLENNGNETFESRISRLTETARVPVIVPGQSDPQEVYSF